MYIQVSNFSQNNSRYASPIRTNVQMGNFQTPQNPHLNSPSYRPNIFQNNNYENNRNLNRTRSTHNVYREMNNQMNRTTNRAVSPLNNHLNRNLLMSPNSQQHQQQQYQQNNYHQQHYINNNFQSPSSQNKNQIRHGSPQNFYESKNNIQYSQNYYSQRNSKYSNENYVQPNYNQCNDTLKRNHSPQPISKFTNNYQQDNSKSMFFFLKKKIF